MTTGLTFFQVVNLHSHIFVYTSIQSHGLILIISMAGSYQMPLTAAEHNMKNVHLYTSWYVDEINFGNALHPDKQSNFISAKFGAHISNFIVPNLFATLEYTRTNPITYRHYILTSTFTNDDYNLGNYLGDNSQEEFASLGYKPISKLYIEVSYNKAQK